MKFKDKYNIEPGFEDLFSFKNKQEELDHEAKMIMFRFLSELDKLFSEKPIKKKDLAEAIHTSRSFITQLYQGDKLINLINLAKIQDAYNLTFEIKAKLNSENYSEEVENCFPNYISHKGWNDETGYWVFINNKPNYQTDGIEPIKTQPKLKVA